jgi:DnaJ like chaperone protein
MMASSSSKNIGIMNNGIWGKLIGSFFGFSLGGPLGSILGLIVGHLYDTRSVMGPAPVDANIPFSGTSQQVAFTTGIIVLSAKLAKVDGQVTRQEIETFKRVFNITRDQEKAVGRLFDQARQSADGFEPYAFQLASLFHHNVTVLEEVLGGLFIIASSDANGITPVKLNFLKKIGTIFGFDLEDFMRIAARAGVRLPSGEHATLPNEDLIILGVTEKATNDEIKAAYRKLIREHHPDKLVALGMAPSFIATATEKMKRINAAYDAVSKMRGIK